MKQIQIFTIIYLIGITILSLATFKVENLHQVTFSGLDKIIHFCFYFGLSFLLSLSFFAKNQSVKLYTLIAITLFSIGYSGIVELIQPLFNRESDIFDFLANSLGAVLGTVAFKAIRKHLCCYSNKICYFYTKQKQDDREEKRGKI